jgi:hypothetical protein
LALYIKEYVLKHPRFELVIEEVDTFNVCFWIIPTKMHKADFKTDD